MSQQYYYFSLLFFTHFKIIIQYNCRIDIIFAISIKFTQILKKFSDLYSFLGLISSSL